MNARETDRLPPHSPEAEQHVLSCVLQDPQTCMGACVERIATPETFYDLRNQTIYAQLIGMYDRRLPIAGASLVQELQGAKLLEQVGLPYVAGLPEITPSPANLNYYLDILLEKFQLRRAVQICTDVVSRIYNGDCSDVAGLLDRVEADVLSIRQVGKANAVATMREAVRQGMDAIEGYLAKQGEFLGLPTGFADLDRMIGGLAAGDIFIIAARPSMGKTSLAMNIAEHVGIDMQIPVGVFSLEMTTMQLAIRMICSRARVNIRRVREGFLTERDMPKLTGAAARLAGGPIFIDDTRGLSIMQLRARARRMVQQHSIKLFVVDYLQLMHSTGRVDNRQTEVAAISRGLKTLAGELEVPIVALSQLNREVEKEKNRKPRMSDLRESGAVENDADIVGLLYKTGKQDEDSEGRESDCIPVNLLIAKQRNGPTGDVPLTFLKSFTRFENASKVSDEDVPTQREFNQPHNDA